jgi:hypothetical protein
MDKNPDLHDPDTTENWSRLLKSKYKKEIGEISREYPYKRSLYIDYRDVERLEKQVSYSLTNFWKIPVRYLKMSGRQ